MDLNERRGISLEDAYRHLATEAELAELDGLNGCRELLSRHVAYQVVAPAHERERAARYFRLMKTLEQRVLVKLRSSEMVATAFALPLTASSGRTEVSRELWDIIELNFLDATASGGGLKLIKIEISLASGTLGVALPADPESRQHRAVAPPSEKQLHLSDDDEILVINAVTMIIKGEIQQSIVRQLVDAWPSGKRLKTQVVLKGAGSNADSIAKAFNGSPNWEHLRPVIRQERGYCWLEI